MSDNPEQAELQDDLVNLMAEKMMLLERIAAIDLEIANIKDILTVEFNEVFYER